jgi:hypothetical protein
MPELRLSMSFKDIKARLRQEAAEEAMQAAEQEAQIEQSIRKWKRRTIYLGVALATSIGSVVPFSEGHPLHGYAGVGGKFFVYLSMCLLAVFMYAAGITYSFWQDLRDTKTAHRKFAPPGSKYRTGK